jgi:hypothetical protein
LNNTLSIIGVAYGVMWLLSFWIHNTIYITIVSGLGVVLLVIVAIGVDGLFGDVDDGSVQNVSLKLKIENLQKEIDSLKEKKSGNKEETKELL